MPLSPRLKKANLSWVRPLVAGAGARYRQIATQILTAVEDGVLRPGDRLPPQRELAQTLGVDLTTVTRAYAEVRQQGMLEAQGAGGTYVAYSGAGSGATIDLGMNIPPLLGSAAFSQMLAQASGAAQAAADGMDLMSYHVGAGAQRHRQAGAQWLRPMIGETDSERVVVCPGAQSAIAALLLAKSQSADAIACDALTYPGFLAAARLLQRQAIGVKSDAHGMDPADLERVCEQHRPAMLYLNPTIQNPTTLTLSLERRAALLRVAQKYALPVIEDDPYWRLAEQAPSTMFSLAAQTPSAPVYYVSTLSKCMAPGLRTAYLVVPGGEPLSPVLDALRSLALMPAAWMTEMASAWIESGTALQWLAQVKEELRHRQAIAASILPGPIQADPNGLHLWLQLPRDIDLYRLTQTALQQGVSVTDSGSFAAGPASPMALRVSLGGALDRARLAHGLDCLAALLKGDLARRVFPVV
ncbi:PLP-dependent aminotransferase family protein [Bordetella genomosp. 12]|uniref:GntR family transcriptional regulator n=1 Tax=Bordetella genomosp. 12 TaxID=463035 RepID=A0A261VT36_9BORD|nr:PLP-dependent aminotransferase family protein [Bordetella genomosp. 12]OZI77189.1 GntR family transcriptional regulator [Bordetella genomosp. 12]